jgi:hypothetical protein
LYSCGSFLPFRNEEFGVVFTCIEKTVTGSSKMSRICIERELTFRADRIDSKLRSLLEDARVQKDNRHIVSRQ